MNLLSKKCIPCEGGATPLTKEQTEEYLKEATHWKSSSDGLKIIREVTFKDFKEAMGFINRVAEIAESEGHHPDIFVSYNQVRLELSTHAIKGLSENDFIVAAKINELL